MTIIIDPQGSGIAGNMLIGAFVDLGADADELKQIMESSAKEFGKVNVNFSKISKHGIESTFCNVEMVEHKHSINFKEFISKIEKLELDDKIKTTSINIFKRIAEAEAKVHGKSLEEVHFHEVGASDAVADVIGSLYAYYSLGYDNQKIIGLPIAVGGGRVNTTHGIIPVPVPAVVEILKEANMVGGPVDSELATPTGCAIYMELCDEIKEFVPMIKAEKVGYGAGRKDFDHPNVLRIIESSEICESDEIDVIETNIDHLTGEEIGYLFDVLLDAGASDVSITPIIMKKNRQGSLLKVISKKDKREIILDAIFKETGSLGIRIAPNIHRGISKREFEKKTFMINGKDYEVTFKIGYVNGEIISKRPEYEDLKRIAEDSGLPLKEVKELVR
ncbi:nickel pincer cofactor biosynthesis protein LarC [Methanobrevibacter sp.]|uniref:nickel pincer cofactor biosynthesis protein LarC n=1 Tax=Methanobrevibacter sp. TaxID=66852 RepID=UPI0025EE9808|nr:nickel pincer cofactor biosynthesis protein LarC [Methanobrevibacter sp.]MBQ2666506.1 nickel pincer cofactor biosynthesis protein LarC [Methanobrevibacter sp.]